ncbi:MAG: GerMN domain-containing protein [Cetobacterium sp.]
MSNKLKLLLIGLICITAFTGLQSNKLNKKSEVITKISSPVSEEVSKNDIITTIFIPNFKAQKLVNEEIILNSNLILKEDILKDIIEQLITKLETNKIIKKDIFKYEVYIKNRTLYLDLDSKILLSATNPEEELLLIYSFVNTLLTPGGADNLVLLINGSSTDKVNFININKTYRLNNNI